MRKAIEIVNEMIDEVEDEIRRTKEIWAKTSSTKIQDQNFRDILKSNYEDGIRRWGVLNSVKSRLEAETAKGSCDESDK